MLIETGDRITIGLSFFMRGCDMAPVYTRVRGTVVSLEIEINADSGELSYTAGELLADDGRVYTFEGSQIVFTAAQELINAYRGSVHRSCGGGR